MRLQTLPKDGMVACSVVSASYEKLLASAAQPWNICGVQAPSDSSCSDNRRELVTELSSTP